MPAPTAEQLHDANGRAYTARLIANYLARRSKHCTGRWAIPAAWDAANAEQDARAAEAHADELTRQVLHDEPTEETETTSQ